MHLSHCDFIKICGNKKVVKFFIFFGAGGGGSNTVYLILLKLWSEQTPLKQVKGQLCFTKKKKKSISW